MPQKHLSGLTERESVSRQSPIKIAGSSLQEFELAGSGDFWVLGFSVGMGFFWIILFLRQNPQNINYVSSIVFELAPPLK